MAESKGIKCTPVAGIGYTLPLLRRREDLFVTQQEREYAILADIVSGDLYEYDKVNKLISESDIERFANSKLKWKKGWGIIGFPNHVNFITETDGKEKVMTHNHPDSNSSFSDTDVNTLLSAAQRGMIEMRAVTDYYIHIVQLPKDSEKYFSEEKEPTSIQELNRSKVTGRMNYWTKKLVSENPELTHYKSYESYEDDPILQKYLNPDLVNEKKYMGESGPGIGTHYGMWVELDHLSVETALAEFDIPYSRVRRQTNKEFQNDIKDDKPDPEKIDDTKKEQLTEKPKPQKTFTDDKPKRVFVPKSTKKDMRYDVLPINPRDRIDLKTRRRNPYPWEDKKYFDKIKKEADTKKAELDNISNTQDVIESDNKLQKRKAKTKGTKDMVEIVKPSKFDWVPLGKRAIGYGKDEFGGPGINPGSWHPDGWKFRLVPGAEKIKSKDTALGMVSSRNKEVYENGKLPKSFLVSIEGECKAVTCMMHYQAAPNYIAMRDAAKKEGILINYSNCYRPYETQIDYWFNNKRPLGERERFISKPIFSGGKEYGTRDEVVATTSNHGFGKAIDVSYYASRGVGTAKQQEDAQKWINMNGNRFGWYWGDAQDENWHFVFVGK